MILGPVNKVVVQLLFLYSIIQIHIKDGLTDSVSFNIADIIEENILILPVFPYKFNPYHHSTVQFAYVKVSQSIKYISSSNSRHLLLFPLSIHALLRSTTVHSFSASLSQGQWKTSLWGTLPPGERYDSGGDITVLGSKISSEQEWAIITNGLSGILCASFGSINYHSHVMKIHLQDIHHKESDSIILTSFLPLETFCTENLTPFVKLLACHLESGYFKLFRQPRWFAKQPYRHLRIQATRVGNVWEFRATLSVIVRLPTIVTFNDMLNIPYNDSLLTWIDQHIFTNELSDLALCAVAKNNTFIHFGSPNITSSSLQSIQKYPMLNPPVLSLFTVKGSEFANIMSTSLQHKKKSPLSHFTLTEFPRYVECSTYILINVFTHLERLQSRFVINFKNNKETPRLIKYFGTIPYIIQPLLHTIEVTIQKNNISTSLKGVQAFKALNIRWDFPRNQSMPAQFVLSFSIESHTSVIMQFDFWKRFLHIGHFSFSPDRGLLLPGGIFIEQLLDTEIELANKLYQATHWDLNEGIIHSPSYTGLWRFTESHYLMFALPDLSMPFNVASISSTIMMLFFGSIFRITAVKVSETPEKKKMVLIKNILVSLLKRFKNKSSQ